MFGASVPETADGFAVGTPKAVFPPGDTVAYIAQLREPPGATVIERRPVAVSPGGIETFARRDWLHLASPDATLLASSLGQVCKGCTTDRTSKRTFVRGGIVVVEGTFAVSPDAAATPTPG